VDEQIPFTEIAKRKNKKITFGSALSAKTEHIDDTLHLDMDMVEESIRNAVARTQRDGKTIIADKLQRLLDGGADSEKIEFVLGSGTYYFPEDLNRAAQIARTSSDATNDRCRKVCDNVCWMVCKCVTGGEQQCGERCRQICSVVCS
jgi:hypothetical protein